MCAHVFVFYVCVCVCAHVCVCVCVCKRACVRERVVGEGGVESKSHARFVMSL